MADKKQLVDVLNQGEVIALSGNTAVRDDPATRDRYAKQYGSLFTGKGRNGVQVPLAALIAEGILPEGTTYEQAKAEAAEIIAKEKASKGTRPRKTASAVSGGRIPKGVTLAELNQRKKELADERKQAERDLAQVADLRKHLTAVKREQEKVDAGIQAFINRKAELEAQLAEINEATAGA